MNIFLISHGSPVVIQVFSRPWKVQYVVQLTMKLLISMGALVAMTACNIPSTPGAATREAATPEVVATYWTAELVGELVEIEGCLRVNAQNVPDTSYALVWPPDLTAVVDKDTVQVITGLVTGSRKEVVLHIGEMVRLSGGVANCLNEQLRQTLPTDCPGPYWAVGIEVGPFEPK